MAGVVAAFQGHGVAKVQAGRTRSQSRISTYGNVRRTLHAPKVGNIVETDEIDMEEPPRGMRSYETLLLMRPDVKEEERREVLDGLEEELKQNGAYQVEMLDRGEQTTSYYIKDYISMSYISYLYVAPPQAADSVQAYLSKPVLAGQPAVVRQMTWRKDKH